MGSSHTHDGEMLAIVETFKNWEPCQLQARSSRLHRLYLRRFRYTKGSSSRQVCGARELSRYHFRIDYCQGKANGAADALSRSSSSLSLTPLHQVLICDSSTPSSYLRNARPPSATSILEMRAGRRRPSPGLGRRCLMAGRMSRESSRPVLRS